MSYKRGRRRREEKKKKKEEEERRKKKKEERRRRVSGFDWLVDFFFFLGLSILFWSLRLPAFSFSSPHLLADPFEDLDLLFFFFLEGKK